MGQEGPQIPAMCSWAPNSSFNEDEIFRLYMMVKRAFSWSDCISLGFDSQPLEFVSHPIVNIMMSVAWPNVVRESEICPANKCPVDECGSNRAI